MRTTTSARAFVLGAVTMMFLASSATTLRAEDRTPGETERAQVAPVVVQHYIPHDSRSINQFEPPKEEGVPYEGFKLQWGGGFTQQFQALHHTNNPTPAVPLKNIGAGFNNASANMYMDAQLAQGIRVEMTTYLSSRHHNESWVKDGFLLIDGSPWENGTLDNLMKIMTLKAGHFEVNYGDAHFRSSDNGNAMANPFVGNLIMNAFTTEIGAEAYFRKNGWMAMAGATAGEIRGTVVRNDTLGKGSSPTYLAKLGYDRKMNDKLRVRVTGSLYTTKESISNTLYSGSRAGSRYFEVLVKPTETVSASAWTGDIQPGLSSEITATVVNPFIKFGGLEFFGNFEQAQGRTGNEMIANAAKRKWTQMSGDAIYRFAWDDLYACARYNTVKGRFAGFASDVEVDRVQVGGGWFMTPNILMKAEYVRQEYKDYPSTSQFFGGVFEGVMVEGVVAF